MLIIIKQNRSQFLSHVPFWLFTLCPGAIWLILSLLLSIDIMHRGRHAKSLLPMLILLWPSLAVQCKRWHDREKSAWWLLIGLVPIVGPLWTGTAGENRYGEDPLGRVSKDSEPGVDVSQQKNIAEVEWKPQINAAGTQP
jgi:uncharacterized membrane protein YhaH (DUF805 family)